MNFRIKWKTVIPLAGIAGIVILTAAAFTLLRTPSWYEIPEIADAQRQDVRNNLVAAEQAFTESVRTGRQPFVYHLYQDDVNRWIAMRREIYPLIDELTPPELADPMVLFAPGEITLAGRYRKAGVDVVISIDVSLRYESDAIVLRAGHLRCGSMRVPFDFAKLGLDRPVVRQESGLWPGSPPMRGDFISGIRIDSNGWWKNGGFAYRVLDLQVTDGRIDLKVEPLGHQPRSRHKDQD